MTGNPLFDITAITGQFTTSKGDSCLSCKLFADCKNPKLKAQGPEDAEVYILLGRPTSDDDVQDLSGKYYRDIMSALSAEGFAPSDCRVMHSVRCHSVKDDKQGKSIKSCRKYIMEDIKTCKPKVIFAVGGDAMTSLYGENYSNSSVSLNNTETLSGFVIPHRDLEAWVVPLFTPEYVAMKRVKWQPQAELIWTQDIARGLEHLDISIHPRICPYDSKLVLLTEDKDIEWALYRWTLDKPKMIAFDYEATGLKPYREGQEILCVAICDGHKSYAFPFPLSERAEQLYKDIMQDPTIKKIAHNAKFEQMWTREKLGVDVASMAYDPSLMAHILCNKRGVTGLKFQTFIHFGVGDYAKSTKGFIEGKPEECKWNEEKGWQKYTHANCFNKLKEFPLLQNLRYCALDSWFTYQLAKIQVSQLKDPKLASPLATKAFYGYDLYHRGSLAMGDIERNGIKIDTEYLEDTMENIKKEIEEIKIKLPEEPLIKEWKEWQGDKFNIDSNPQLSKFLYEFKEFECTEFTDRGAPSTDADALMKLGQPSLESLIHYKKLYKILNTFLKGFYFEKNGDILHPFYSLNIAVSGRSSSRNPNMQNNSKHDKIYSAYVRKAIIPHDGQYLAELDYKSLEVLCGLYYHGDKNMYRYLVDPNSDQHSDTASHLFLDIKKDTKDHMELFNRLTGGKKHKKSGDPMRSLAKRFNFATFFGSNHFNTAKWTWSAMPDMYMEDGTPYQDYLAEQGIKTFKQWDKHVESIDNNFWNVRFAEYGAWRNKNYKDYQTRGYFDNYMGFRYKGMMAKTKTSNLGIQGNGFQILCAALIRLNDWLKDNDKKTKIIGQVHDSILMSIEPSEAKEVITKAKEFMEDWTYDYFDYVNIKLQVDVDISEEPDQDWTMLKATSYEDIMAKDW